METDQPSRDDYIKKFAPVIAKARSAVEYAYGMGEYLMIVCQPPAKPTSMTIAGDCPKCGSQFSVREGETQYECPECHTPLRKVGDDSLEEAFYTTTFTDETFEDALASLGFDPNLLIPELKKRLPPFESNPGVPILLIDCPSGGIGLVWADPGYSDSDSDSDSESNDPV